MDGEVASGLAKTKQQQFKQAGSGLHPHEMDVACHPDPLLSLGLPAPGGEHSGPTNCRGRTITPLPRGSTFSP